MAAVAPDADPPPGRPANELPDAAELRARFDAAPRYTVGLEEEVMVLDPETLELTPRAPELLDRLGHDGPFKLELPASQLEITTPVASLASELAAPLWALRREAAAAASGLASLAAAAVHPMSAGVGELNRFDRYGHTLAEFGPVARRQLVCALHVHVAVGGADIALPVYNAARSYLPPIAALAANGAVYEGRDSGLASVRPKLCELLPRQGVPPALESWEELAAAYRWGAASGGFQAPRTWWWELRLHPAYGTLEFRVPDAQSTVRDAVAVASLVQALVVWLAERVRGGERPAVAPDWRIAENRWSACRHGLRGTLADLETGRPRPTSELVGELLDTLDSVAAGLGAGESLRAARDLLRSGGGATAQRARYGAGGASGVANWLTRCFLTPPDG